MTILFSYKAPFISETASIVVEDFEETIDGEVYQYTVDVVDNGEVSESTPFKTLEEVLDGMKYDLAWCIQHAEIGGANDEMKAFVAKAELRQL